MGKKLNMDTFNEILFGAMKDQGPRGKRDLLLGELQMAYNVKIQSMEKVIDDLNKGLPYHKDLTLVNNVDSNLNAMGRQIEEIEKQHPELTEEA